METNEKKNEKEQPPKNKPTRQQGTLKNKATGNQLTKDDPEVERRKQTKERGDGVDTRQNSGKETSTDPTSQASQEKEKLSSDIRNKTATRNDERGAQPYDEQQFDQQEQDELNQDQNIVNEQEDSNDPNKYKGL